MGLNNLGKSQHSPLHTLKKKIPTHKDVLISTPEDNKRNRLLCENHREEMKEESE